MSAELIHEYVSPEEYLKRERGAEFRHEYAGGRMYAMSGASREHSIIAGNIFREISLHLRNKPCEVHSGEMRVRVTPFRYTYPDLVVACDEVQFDEEGLDTLLNPVIIVEILSPSTEAYDRGQIFASYRRLHSLEEYVLVSQDKACIEHYHRRNAQWLLTEISAEAASSEAVLSLHAIDFRISLEMIYEKVRLPTPSPAGESSPSSVNGE